MTIPQSADADSSRVRYPNRRTLPLRLFDRYPIAASLYPPQAAVGFDPPLHKGALVMLKGIDIMHIEENPNKEIVAMIREGLKAKDGYCPCRLEKTPENKCICEEFKAQMADPEFEGFCHCMLYYKYKD